MSDEVGTRRGIPDATVARLPIYLRALTLLAEEGTATVSSEELAALAGVNSAKLRKDLSHLGSYGVRGVGYEVDYLVYQISRELGLTQDWPVAIVGIGNLGHALANYGGFASRGFSRRRAARPGRQRCGRAGRRPPRPAARRARAGRPRAGVAIGVVATPAAAAQEVCDRLVAAGVRSVLNFAPCVLSVPPGVDVRKVDLSTELQILAFHEQRRAAAERPGGGDGGRADEPARRRSVAPHRAARAAGAGRPRPGAAPRAQRAGPCRGEHVAEVRGPGDLQPGRGVRRVGDLPRRPVRPRRGAGRRPPACRSTS